MKDDGKIENDVDKEIFEGKTVIEKDSENAEATDNNHKENTTLTESIDSNNTLKVQTETSNLNA